MKLSPQFTLPILLGISLTSVSIAVIYLLLKKDEEDTSARRNGIAFAKRIVIEYKVPRKFVPAIIGRGGYVIKDIEKKTGTQICFKENNPDRPDSPDRICLIRGCYENTQMAQEIIKSIINDQPIIETYEIFVPHKACSKIIGKGGESIRYIQTVTGAKVIVEKCGSYVQNADKRIIIKGTAEQIAAALLQIEKVVKRARGESIDEETIKESFAKLEPSSAVKLPIQTIKHSQSNESLSLPGLSTDGIMEVYVSAIESPSKFWVQIVGRGTTALDKLVSDMTAYYNEEQNQQLHKLKDITPGQVCVAKFNYDEKWYRAYIISVSLEDNECEVFFMDYGDHDVVPFEFILEIRLDFLSLVTQAMECCLNNVKPRDGEWSVQACDRFAEFTSVAQWKILTAKIEGYIDRVRTYGESQRKVTIYSLDLFDRDDDKDINVALELINEGLADAVEPLLLSSRSTSRPSSAASVEKRTSTKTPANSSQKMDSSVEMISLTQNTTIDFDRSSSIEEINTSTPRRSVHQIEEIDLVTPEKVETANFIENEIKSSDDHLRNGSGGNQYNRSSNIHLNRKNLTRIAPAGYESDLSDDSDELELG